MMKTFLRVLFYYLGAFTLVLVNQSSHAALNDPCGCNAGLAPRTSQSASSSKLSLAFLQQIDEKQYEQLKRDGSAGADIMGLISGTANYSEFNVKRREHLSSTNFSLNSEQSQSLLLSSVDTGAWAICKKECIKNQQGFACDVGAFVARTISISCMWRPEDATAARKIEAIVNGTREPGSRTIKPHTPTDWQFPRDPEQDLLITMKLEGGSSQTLRIAATPKDVPEPPRPVSMGSCLGRGGVDGVQFWGPEGQHCNGIPEWGAYQRTSSDPSPTRLCSCTGKGGVDGVRLWGPEGKTCANIPAWGKYDQQCVSATSATICNCFGHGNILDRHLIWGPQGKDCGGMTDPRWGTYSQACVAPR